MSESQKQIMEATFRALHRHGYADLTMDAIASEFDKSKSLLHYHYNTKEELVEAFLEYMHQELVDKTDEIQTQQPETKINEIATLLMSEPDKISQEEMTFYNAVLELKTQARHKPRFRKTLNNTREYVLELLSETLQDGIDRNEFQETETRQAAEMILSAIEGKLINDTTLKHRNQVETEKHVTEIEKYIIKPIKK